MLQIKNISKKYSRKAILENISINFPANKTTALVGANGAGKTTLLKIILGLVEQEKGEIYFNDENISTWKIHKRIRLGLGYMSQESSAIGDLTVEDNIYLVPKMNGSDEEYRENLLEEFSLKELRHRKCHTLSVGELKKLEFCLCLTLRPRLVLLDEPFASLDPKTVSLVMGMITDMRGKDISLIIVDHRVEELRKIAEEYILLDNAGIAFQGSREDFFQSEVVRDRFLGVPPRA
jgi:lipopolysaccharide export system ATP-binding protein